MEPLYGQPPAYKPLKRIKPLRSRRRKPGSCPDAQLTWRSMVVRSYSLGAKTPNQHTWLIRELIGCPRMTCQTWIKWTGSQMLLDRRFSVPLAKNPWTLVCKRQESFIGVAKPSTSAVSDVCKNFGMNLKASLASRLVGLRKRRDNLVVHQEKSNDRSFSTRNTFCKHFGLREEATTLVGVKKYILGYIASTLDKYFKFVFDVDIMRPYVYSSISSRLQMIRKFAHSVAEVERISSTLQSLFSGAQYIYPYMYGMS